MRKFFTSKKVTLGVVGVFVVAMVAALWAPLDASAKVEIVGTLGMVGTSLAGALRGAAKVPAPAPRLPPPIPEERTRI
jgi:hypothetical protein